MKEFAAPIIYVKEAKADSGAMVNEFMFFHEGLMYVCNGYGYKTLADVEKGSSLGFDSSSAKYSVWGDDVRRVSDSYGAERSSDGEVFYFATGLGYKDFAEFQDAVSKGFTRDTAEEYRFALGLRLKGREEYIKYKKFGEAMTNAAFKDENEYVRALKLGLQTKSTYDDYLFLERIKSEYDFGTMQEAHLFIILNRKEFGRGKTLSTLLEILQREQPSNWDYQSRYAEWYDAQTGGFESANFHSGSRSAEWYTEKFRETKNVEEFLLSNPSVRKLGIYYPDRKSYVSFSDKTILIDGSNVAYNNQDKAQGGKPYARNIKLVVDEIKKTGFSDVKVFHDANLPYIVEDKSAYEQLKEEGVLRQIPAATQADDFLIKYAKEYGAHVVTNDTFKDWAGKDAWVASNARNFRIGFMIEDNVVKFSTNYEAIDQTTFTGVDVSAFSGFKSMYNAEKEPRKTIIEGQTRNSYW